jgi:hypothetical protein
MPLIRTLLSLTLTLGALPAMAAPTPADTQPGGADVFDMSLEQLMDVVASRLRVGGRRRSHRRQGAECEREGEQGPDQGHEVTRERVAVRGAPGQSPQQWLRTCGEYSVEHASGV